MSSEFLLFFIVSSHVLFLFIAVYPVQSVPFKFHCRPVLLSKQTRVEFIIFSASDIALLLPLQSYKSSLNFRFQTPSADSKNEWMT